jgi:hypothetical protein
VPCSWLLVAPLEETVKSDRREFPQEMRSTLDRLWKRGTLPQRAGQSPQPERVFRFQPVICSRSRPATTRRRQRSYALLGAAPLRCPRLEATASNDQRRLDAAL